MSTTPSATGVYTADNASGDQSTDTRPAHGQSKNFDKTVKARQAYRMRNIDFFQPVSYGRERGMEAEQPYLPSPSASCSAPQTTEDHVRDGPYDKVVKNEAAVHSLPSCRQTSIGLGQQEPQAEIFQSASYGRENNCESSPQNQPLQESLHQSTFYRDQRVLFQKVSYQSGKCQDWDHHPESGATVMAPSNDDPKTSTDLDSKGTTYKPKSILPSRMPQQPKA